MGTSFYLILYRIKKKYQHDSKEQLAVLRLKKLFKWGSVKLNIIYSEKNSLREPY
jgi:hypothetical protein